MMNDLYYSSFDVGVAVEAEEKKPPGRLTSKSEAKRLRLLPNADAAADTAVLDADTDTTGKISKKKRKREKSGVIDGVINVNVKSSVDAQHQQPPPLKGMFIDERKKLPVYRHRADICNLVANNDVVLVVAETVSFIFT